MPKTVTGLLVGAHIVTVLDLNWFGERIPHPFAEIVLIALLFSQIGLIGIWGGLGTNGWRVRLSGVVSVAIFLLATSIRVYGELDLQTALFVAVPLFSGVILHLVIRHTFAQVSLNQVSAVPANHVPLQFTIRQLMSLTFVVAIVLSIGRLLSPAIPSIEDLAFGTIICVYPTLIGLVSVWAVLGRKHLVFRCVVVSLIAALLGWFASILPYGEPLIWFSIMMLNAIFVLTSLWVFRRYGFRLVPISPGHASPEMVQTPGTLRAWLFDRRSLFVVMTLSAMAMAIYSSRQPQAPVRSTTIHDMRLDIGCCPVHNEMLIEATNTVDFERGSYVHWYYQIRRELFPCAFDDPRSDGELAHVTYCPKCRAAKIKQSKEERPTAFDNYGTFDFDAYIERQRRELDAEYSKE